MEKINLWIKNHIQIILLVFLYFQPVIDLLTSLCIHVLHLNITVGVIARVLFLLFLIYYFLVVEKEKKKSLYLYLGTLFFYFLAFTVQLFIYKDSSVLTYEWSNTLRTFYFPMILVLLMKIKTYQDLKIETNHYLKVIMIYAIFIILPTIFGLNFNGYTEGKVGNIGWFNSTNEISAIFSMMLPIVSYLILTLKNKWYQIGSILILLFVIFN